MQTVSIKQYLFLPLRQSQCCSNAIQYNKTTERCVRTSSDRKKEGALLNLWDMTKSLTIKSGVSYAEADSYRYPDRYMEKKNIPRILLKLM